MEQIPFRRGPQNPHEPRNGHIKNRVTTMEYMERNIANVDFLPVGNQVQISFWYAFCGKRPKGRPGAVYYDSRIPLCNFRKIRDVIEMTMCYKYIRKTVVFLYRHVYSGPF
mgnify:CR=1 FL=1